MGKMVSIDEDKLRDLIDEGVKKCAISVIDNFCEILKVKIKNDKFVSSTSKLVILLYIEETANRLKSRQFI